MSELSSIRLELAELRGAVCELTDAHNRLVSQLLRLVEAEGALLEAINRERLARDAEARAKQERASRSFLRRLWPWTKR